MSNLLHDESECILELTWKFGAGINGTYLCLLLGDKLLCFDRHHHEKNKNKNVFEFYFFLIFCESLDGSAISAYETHRTLYESPSVHPHSWQEGSMHSWAALRNWSWFSWTGSLVDRSKNNRREYNSLFFFVLSLSMEATKWFLLIIQALTATLNIKIKDKNVFHMLVKKCNRTARWWNGDKQWKVRRQSTRSITNSTNTKACAHMGCNSADAFRFPTQTK